MEKVRGQLDLDNKDYKDKQRLTWLAVGGHTPLATPTVCVHFDHLITKGVLKPDEDFKNFVNWNSKVCVSVGVTVVVLVCGDVGGWRGWGGGGMCEYIEGKIVAEWCIFQLKCGRTWQPCGYYGMLLLVDHDREYYYFPAHVM